MLTMYKSVLRILTYSIAGYVAIILILVIHSSTIGKGNTDCMLQYVINHYPNGGVYMIGKQAHIDKPSLSYMKQIGTTDGCNLIGVPVAQQFINEPYCLVARTIFIINK